MTFLLDVSHYNGTINWAQVKADGCVGAYIKVTDGASGVDAMWQTNHANATAAGIPVGPYHFAEGGNPTSEATHFASAWGAGWQLHPVLDYEIGSANATWLANFRTVFRGVSGFGPFRVYTSQGFLAGQLNPVGWIDAATTIWAARYAATLGWTHPALVLWQNTSTANVPGIVGSVDEDQFQNGWTPAADQGATMNWTDASSLTLPGNADPETYNDLLVNTFAELVVGSAGKQVTGSVNGIAADIQNLTNLVTALTGQVTTEQATLLAAIKGVQAGTVNTAQLAQALVPLLAPADAAAFQADLAAALAK